MPESLYEPLNDVLRSVRMTGAVFLHADLKGPWAVYSQVLAENYRPVLHNPTQIICYHYVAEGSMLASMPGEKPQRIEAGEVVVITRNDVHILASAEGLLPVDPRSLIQADPEGGPARMEHGVSGDRTKIICGFLGSEEGFNPLVTALPPLFKIKIKDSASQPLVESSLSFAANEASKSIAAANGVLSRLSEMLFVEALRSYAETAGNGNVTSWLKGLADPQIGKALAAMHKEIKRPWTAEELAEEAAMSRSAFVNRFSEIMGMAPIRYLTTWRLAIGKRALRESARPIVTLAEDLGYSSEDAFSRAFKREYGVSPASWRQA